VRPALEQLVDRLLTSSFALRLPGRMKDGAAVHDMVKFVRADEAHHRLLHHTLASLGKSWPFPSRLEQRVNFTDVLVSPDPRRDTNPFALAEPDSETKATHAGFTREEAAAFVKQARDVVDQKTREVRKAEGGASDASQT
jgi:hypothetical protein